MGTQQLIRRLNLTAGCAAAALLTGCASLAPHLMPPDVSITTVRFLGGSLDREQLQLTAHVVNPNDRAIPIDRIQANIDLAGMPFAFGVSDAPFVLPPLGSYDVELDVTANMGNGLIALAGRMSHRDVPYRVHGEVHLPHGILRVLHFAHQGDLRL